jgi:hypothetical protein
MASPTQNGVGLGDLAERRPEVPALTRKVDKEVLSANRGRNNFRSVQPQQVIVLRFIPVSLCVQHFVDEHGIVVCAVNVLRELLHVGYAEIVIAEVRSPMNDIALKRAHRSFSFPPLQGGTAKSKSGGLEFNVHCAQVHQLAGVRPSCLSRLRQVYPASTFLVLATESLIDQVVCQLLRWLLARRADHVSPPGKFKTANSLCSILAARS